MSKYESVPNKANDKCLCTDKAGEIDLISRLARQWEYYGLLAYSTT